MPKWEDLLSSQIGERLQEAKSTVQTKIEMKWAIRGRGWDPKPMGLKYSRGRAALWLAVDCVNKY